MKQVIYETHGRAREFNEMAVNLFKSCDHQCIYCYGADVTHQDKKAFVTASPPRVTEKDLYDAAAQKAKTGDNRRVLFCFITDPYQMIEAETQITRKAITAMHTFGTKVIILTKGGHRSMRDFDLLGPGDAYATTLTLTGAVQSAQWEPGAACPQERLAALKEAHDRGIETWVSFEPVIYPEETLKLLALSKDFTGHFKVGTMNYHPQGKKTDWHKFGWAIKGVMDDLDIKYYFKLDLLREMRTNPEDFKQTWVCG